MSDDTMPPLFIVGAPRSGTSLLRNLVRACEGVYLPPDETQFFPAYFEKATAGADTEALVDFIEGTAFSGHMRARGTWPERRELLAAFSDPSPEQALPRLMRRLAGIEQQGSFSLWGDKTPKYIYFLDRFREAFPGMRVVFVVRDPRDAVLSMREAWGRSLVRGANAWSEAARIALREMNEKASTDVMLVEYEALTREPRQVMERIAAWLGVGFSAAAIDDYSGEEKWGAVDNDGVVKTSIGRYESSLSESEVELIERICFDEMKLLGYAPKYASRQVSPGSLRLACARVGDAVRSVDRYTDERGLIGGIAYKLRQFVTTRSGKGGA